MNLSTEGHKIMLIGSSIEYIPQTPNNVCKVRGTNLNYFALQEVNLDVIKDMILKKRPDEVVTVYTNRKIKRNRKEGSADSFRGTEQNVQIFVFQEKAIT